MKALNGVERAHKRENGLKPNALRSLKVVIASVFQRFFLVFISDAKSYFTFKNL